MKAKKIDIDIVSTHHRPKLAHHIALRWYKMEHLVHARIMADFFHG